MEISEINVYPFKSIGGISLDKSIVEKRGLQYDRRWMLVDENADLITQREFPKMALISTKLKNEGLEISTTGFENIFVPLKTNRQLKIEVRVWKSFCQAVVLDDEINQWFSEVLQTNCRLVFMPDDTKREVNKIFNNGDDIVSFADGYPILVIGENSLKKLNEKLDKKIPMNRFRPNFVVKDSEGFEEDRWKEIKIGETIFRVTKPCARCVITTIDQQTGITDIKEPLSTMAAFRKAIDVFPNDYKKLDLKKNDVLFGQNLVAENFGREINIGDEVEVLE